MTGATRLDPRPPDPGSSEAPRARPQRALWLGVLALSVIVAGGLALAVTRGGTPGDTGTTSTPLAARTTQIDAADFLATYVEDDGADAGRVVRLDQGGDTVSEGQAYGMLIALVAEDRASFDRIWSWTQAHLAREDGLYSWRWEGGAVVDPSSASDAELDMARALVLAAERFDDPGYAEEGVTLGEAILEHQTVETPAGLVLVAGEWATTPPAWFNPSYVSPVATRLLERASGDARWGDLERGSRAAVEASAPAGQLPPNWAGLTEDGTVYPQDSPDGTAVEYGYDAARTLVRHAESCTASDLEVAVAGAAVIEGNGAADPDRIVAVYDLGGAPRTDATSPLTTVAQAAGLAAAGRDDEAVAALEQAGEQQQDAPTYYGDAWTVLGPALLTDPSLGGCPPLEGVR